jgi:hypothetical protein
MRVSSLLILLRSNTDESGTMCLANLEGVQANPRKRALSLETLNGERPKRARLSTLSSSLSDAGPSVPKEVDERVLAPASTPGSEIGPHQPVVQSPEDSAEQEDPEDTIEEPSAPVGEPEGISEVGTAVPQAATDALSATEQATQTEGEVDSSDKTEPGK